MGWGNRYSLIGPVDQTDGDLCGGGCCCGTDK